MVTLTSKNKIKYELGFFIVIHHPLLFFLIVLLILPDLMDLVMSIIKF